MFEQVDRDFGECSPFEVMDHLVQVADLDVVDVGCGAGDLAKALAMRDARVIAIEPNPEQADANALAVPIEGLTYVEAGAEALPCSSASFDGVFFSKSLHHVPFDAMAQGLGESIRVLRDDGFLYVLEPEVEGPYSALMRPFHDETLVRGQALGCLARYALPAFAQFSRSRFTVSRRYDDFDAFADAVMGLSYNTYTRHNVTAPAVRAHFETGWDGTSFQFEQPMSVYLFQDKSGRA